jgi:hypothetical protein
MMNEVRRRSRGQTLAEILLAVVFLATGGLVIYSSAVRSMQGAGWEADRVFGQGLLRDLLEVYGALDFCQLEDMTKPVPGLRATTMGDPAEEENARKIASEAGFQDQFEDTQASSPVRPLQYPSFFQDPTKPQTKEEMEAKDPIYKEYRATMRRIEAKRVVLWKKDTSGGKKGSGVLSAYVFFTAANGAKVVLRGHTIVFHEGKDPCP